MPARAAVEVLVGGRGPGLERAVVSSFDPVALERIGRLAPTWPRWLNSDERGRRRRSSRRVELGCRGIAVEWHALDARLRGPLPRRPASRSRPGPSAAARRSIAWSGSASTRSASRPPRSTAERPRAAGPGRIHAPRRARHRSRPAAYPPTMTEHGSRGPRGRRRRHDRRLGVRRSPRSTGSAGSSSSSAGWPGRARAAAPPGIVRAQGGTPTTVALGRWSIDFYRGQPARLRDRLAASASSAT